MFASLAQKCSYHDVEMIPAKISPRSPESVKDDSVQAGWFCPQCWLVGHETTKNPASD